MQDSVLKADYGPSADNKSLHILILNFLECKTIKKKKQLPISYVCLAWASSLQQRKWNTTAVTCAVWSLFKFVLISQKKKKS